jgi:hypothetical protein
MRSSGPVRALHYGGAVSELAGSLLHLAAGYAALSKATPGALSAGTAAATAIAQHLAIIHFWLGSTVGAWYYAVFPVAVSAGLVAATMGALLAAGGVVTALAWIVLDPWPWLVWWSWVRFAWAR